MILSSVGRRITKFHRVAAGTRGRTVVVIDDFHHFDRASAFACLCHEVPAESGMK